MDQVLEPEVHARQVAGGRQRDPAIGQTHLGRGEPVGSHQGVVLEERVGPDVVGVLVGVDNEINIFRRQSEQRQLRRQPIECSAKPVSIRAISSAPQTR